MRDTLKAGENQQVLAPETRRSHRENFVQIGSAKLLREDYLVRYAWHYLYKYNM